jgi:hypothetical protein
VTAPARATRCSRPLSMTRRELRRPGSTILVARLEKFTGVGIAELAKTAEGWTDWAFS